MQPSRIPAWWQECWCCVQRCQPGEVSSHHDPFLLRQPGWDMSHHQSHLCARGHLRQVCRAICRDDQVSSRTSSPLCSHPPSRCCPPQAMYFFHQCRQIKVGDPSDPSNMMGALVSKEHLAKVRKREREHYAMYMYLSHAVQTRDVHHWTIIDLGLLVKIPGDVVLSCLENIPLGI